MILTTIFPLPPLLLLLSSLLLPSSSTTHAQDIDPRTIRCPGGPFVAVTKNPPVPVSGAGGCGSTKGSLPVDVTPDYLFVPCCNAHDACWADCSRTFEECNALFGQCTNIICNTVGRVDPRCPAFASIYLAVLNLAPEPRNIFQAATTAHCDCVCSNRALTRCGNSCLDLRNDNNNCGTCGFVCSPGTLCQAGRCVSPPPACVGGCNDAPRCGPAGSTSCYCATSVSGPGCVQNVPCAGLPRCTGGTCPPGFSCIVSTCCGNFWCVPQGVCSGGGIARAARASLPPPPPAPGGNETNVTYAFIPEGGPLGVGTDTNVVRTPQ